MGARWLPSRPGVHIRLTGWPFGRAMFAQDFYGGVVMPLRHHGLQHGFQLRRCHVGIHPLVSAG